MLVAAMPLFTVEPAWIPTSPVGAPFPASLDRNPDCGAVNPGGRCVLFGGDFGGRSSIPVSDCNRWGSNLEPSLVWPRSWRSASFPAEAHPPLRPFVVYPDEQVFRNGGKKKTLTFAAISDIVPTKRTAKPHSVAPELMKSLSHQCWGQCVASARLSHARATLSSCRITWAERPAASAISSAVIPPK
jgi:hypothetical protein